MAGRSFGTSLVTRLYYQQLYHTEWLVFIYLCNSDENERRIKKNTQL